MSVKKRLLASYLKLFLSIVLAVCLFSCNDPAEKKNIRLNIVVEDFVIKIPAQGELKATKETPISMPTSVFEPQVIEWLTEENSFVKKDEVVARFDSQKYRYQSQQEQFEIDKSKIGFQTKENVLLNEKGEIVSDNFLIKEELAIASLYSSEDLSVYSRNEIIDSMKNQQYLQAKRDYTDWRGESHEAKSVSELELLKLQQGQHSAKLNMYVNALNQLEVKAPHDGIFVLERNWRGDKARVGDTTWPGRKIASLPDLSKLHAKIFILESEAAGIKVGQSVDLKLDAYPEQLFKGQLEQLDSIAKPRESDSPVKYFEAMVSIDGEKNSNWRPGSQLQAMIYVTSLNQVISIPTQAIRFDNQKYFVRVENDNEWQQREIQIGQRSSSKTEVTEGLSAGDVIALFPESNKTEIDKHEMEETELKKQGEKNAVL